jgi:hypothetical protein
MKKVELFYNEKLTLENTNKDQKLKLEELNL